MPKPKTTFRNSRNLQPSVWAAQGRAIRLTSEGLSWSDVIGPWLYSRRVTSRMEAFEIVAE